MMEAAIAIIPARMDSSRYPGKPLKEICGISMIEHVRRRALMCSSLNDVIVATCDEEIIREVERHGGKAVMTSDQHESCVDRVAEAAEDLGADIIVNVQGDMPLVQPESLEKLIAPFKEGNSLMYTDMMGPIENEKDVSNANVVKVVVDQLGNAMYYTRESIPSSKKAGSNAMTRYKQLGINAYRYKALQEFTRLERTPLERIESVDMLRLLENGLTVRMVSSAFPIVGVDTEEDLKLAEQMMKKDELFLTYGQGKCEYIHRT